MEIKWDDIKDLDIQFQVHWGKILILDKKQSLILVRKMLFLHKIS